MSLETQAGLFSLLNTLQPDADSQRTQSPLLLSDNEPSGEQTGFAFLIKKLTASSNEEEGEHLLPQAQQLLPLSPPETPVAEYSPSVDEHSIWPDGYVTDDDINIGEGNDVLAYIRQTEGMLKSWHPEIEHEPSLTIDHRIQQADIDTEAYNRELSGTTELPSIQVSALNRSHPYNNQPLSKQLPDTTQVESDSFTQEASGHLDTPDSEVTSTLMTHVKAAGKITTSPDTSTSPASSASIPSMVMKAAEPESLEILNETEIEAKQEHHASELSALKERLIFGRDERSWTPALGQKIVTMVGNQVQEAAIHLDPPELGSLEVKLHIQQEQASVHIQVQHPQVRDVLESQAQRLREALAEQGLTLNNFDVSEQSQQQGGNAHSNPETDEFLSDAEEAPPKAMDAPSALSSGQELQGFIDAYA